MSIERRLLIKAVEFMHELKYVWLEERDCGDRALLELIADINNIELLLAQPEQNIAMAVMPNGVCVSNVYDAYEAGRASVLLAQPEHIVDVTDKVEPVAWGDEEIKALYDRHAFAMESDEYMWGFRDAEKAHGITGDEQ
jgi:hypothetical protein